MQTGSWRLSVHNCNASSTHNLVSSGRGRSSSSHSTDATCTQPPTVPPTSHAECVELLVNVLHRLALEAFRANLLASLLLLHIPTELVRGRREEEGGWERVVLAVQTRIFSWHQHWERHSVGSHAPGQCPHSTHKACTSSRERISRHKRNRQPTLASVFLCSRRRASSAGCSALRFPLPICRKEKMEKGGRSGRTQCKEH